MSIGAAEPQEVFYAARNPSRACGTPIAKLSRPPAKPPPVPTEKFPDFLEIGP